MGIMRSPGIDVEQLSPSNTARRVVGLLASRPHRYGKAMSVRYARRREEGVWAWPFLAAFGVGLLACQGSTERTNRDASAGGAGSAGTAAAADAKAGTGGAGSAGTAAAADAKAGTGGAAAGDAEVGRCAPAGVECGSARDACCPGHDCVPAGATCPRPSCVKNYCVPNGAVACNLFDCPGLCCDRLGDAGAMVCSDPSKHHASTPPSTDGTCSFSCAGACARGRCLTTVVSTRKQPAGIALGGTDVFWLERDSDAWSYVVARAPLTGGVSTTLTSRPGAPSEFQGIAVDETSVYWAEQGPDSGAILKMPRAGGPAVTLASGLRAPRSLALDGMNVYFTHEIATAPAGALLSVSTNGGSPSTLAAELHEHTDVAVDAGYVYLLAHDAQGASIKKLPVAGGAPSTLATGLRLPRSIAVDTSHVYWTDVNTVMRAPLAGGAGATLLASAQSLDFVATDGALVYWLSGGAEGTVMSVPVGGGTSSALLAQQHGPLRDLVVNDRGIFWTSSDACNGMIMRLAAE